MYNTICIGTSTAITLIIARILLWCRHTVPYLRVYFVICHFHYSRSLYTGLNLILFGKMDSDNDTVRRCQHRSHYLVHRNFCGKAWNCIFCHDILCDPVILDCCSQNVCKVCFQQMFVFGRRN